MTWECWVLRTWSSNMSTSTADSVRLCFLLIALLCMVTCRRAAAQSGGELSRPVEFVASDSLRIALAASDRTASLIGNASVVYEDVKLTAWTIDIFFDIDELRARGRQTGEGAADRPTIIQAGEEFSGTSLAFNLNTRRGRIVAAETQIEDGFIRAGVVKAIEDNTLFIRDGVYTTCNCTTNPSYSLRSKKMKMVGDDWIYTGPIQLFLFNIPTPLWLPFGFLPARDTRRSGPLPPTYGEDEFGFYLRDFGWYFAMNEFMDLQLQSGFWTQGSWETRGLYRYRKRYAFDGQLQMDYARFRNGVRGDPLFAIRQTSAFRWTHNQTIGQTATFNTNVNLSSTSFLRAVSQQYDDRVRQDLQSSLRYTQRWSSRSMSVQASQRQSLANGQVNMVLPAFRFSQNNIKVRNTVTAGYTLNVDNRFDFTPLSDAQLQAAGDPAAADISWWDALRSPSDFRRATGKEDPFSFRASHRIPVSAPFSVQSLPVLGNVRLNLSPDVTYTEDWFLRTEERQISADSSTVETSSRDEFFALRQFSSSVNSSTVFYGQFPARFAGLSRIRHTVRPNVGFSYRPDFFDEKWGYTRTVTTPSGEETRFAVVPGVSRGEQRAMTFSVNNTFEAKKQDSPAGDPGASGGTIVKLFDLSAASSYNFAADSLKLADLRLTARTRVAGKIDVDARSTFSPYDLSPSGGLTRASAFSLATPLGRMTSLNVTIRTSLRSRTGAGDRPMTSPRGGFLPGGLADPSGSAQILQTSLRSPDTDFSIPWSTSIDFTYGITKPGLTTIRRAILNTSFDFSLTPNWKVAGRTGYDVEQRELVTTNIALAHDFDCWQMSFNWIPFGSFQSWGFDLHVKSGHLRDLLRIRQPKSDINDRFRSLL